MPFNPLQFLIATDYSDANADEAPGQEAGKSGEGTVAPDESLSVGMVAFRRSPFYVVPPAESVFGDRVQHTKRGFVLVVGNKGYGRKPLALRLPGQLYAEMVEKWFEEGYRHIEVIEVDGDWETVAHDGSRMWAPRPGRHEAEGVSMKPDLGKKGRHER